MVFCGACQMAAKVCLILKILGLTAVVLTGQMSQKARLLALTRFKANEKNVLVATDVASRGLDIPSVDLVVNFDMPIAPKGISFWFDASTSHVSHRLRSPCGSNCSCWSIW